MNVASVSSSLGWPASKSTGVGASTGNTTAVKGMTGSASPVSGTVESDFLKYAKMSPMERMRANILKSMDLTEEKLAALPQEERQKIEDQIKEQIKKVMSSNKEKGQLVNIFT